MALDNVTKCANPPCECLADEQGEYCSPACSAETDPGMPCRCGHPGCEGLAFATDDAQELEILSPEAEAEA